MNRFKNILLVCDPEGNDEVTVSLGVSLAERNHSDLTLISVLEDPTPELVRREGIDLLVMGTVCRTGVAGFFIGNTAETVLAQVDCSVLSVKPEGFLSPVTLADD